MIRPFFALALLGMLLGWLGMHFVWLAEKGAAGLMASEANPYLACKEARDMEFRSLSIEPTTIACVQAVSDKQLSSQAIVKTVSITLYSSSIIAVLPTLTWRIQNQ